MTEFLLIASVIIEKIPVTVRMIVGDSNFYTVIFLLVIGWIILLMLDTLISVSEVENKTRGLVQENSLLQRRIEQLEENVVALLKDVEKSEDIS